MQPDSGSQAARGHRFQAGIPAALACRGVEYPCTAHNLSRTGVLLVGTMPPPSDPEVEFVLRAPVGEVHGRFRGRVARVESEADGRETHVAIEFVGLDGAQKDVVEVLLARVIEGQTPAPIEALRPGTPPHEVRKALDSVPLPHRIALASRANPREREILRQDANSQVLEALARNPNLLPAEAHALAALPHLLPTTLEVLVTDPRWQRDDELRVLVAAHPRVPFPLADRLISEMKGPALRKVLGRPALNPGLRDRILRRLARGG